MNHHRIAFTALLLAVGTIARAADVLPETVPDKAATRQQIDALIAKFQNEKKKATLGLIQESIDLSISYGAPAWNQGDHDACCNFYMQTAKSLSDAFGKNATPPAAVAIADLNTALARIKNSTDTDHNAWALRFAFDKTQLASDSEAVHASGLLDLGDQYLKRSSFDEAQDAFAAAAAIAVEMDGRSSEKIPIALRFAPLASANALLGQKKYHEAAGAVTKGLANFPEWAQAKVDLRTAYGDPAVYRLLLSDLKAEVERSPKDASLHFLLGYEYFFTGRKEAAQELFKETLKLDPNNAGAKSLLDNGSKQAQPTTNPAPPPLQA